MKCTECGLVFSWLTSKDRVICWGCLEKENAALKAEVEKYVDVRDRLNGRCEEKDKQIAELKEQIAELKEQLATANELITIKNREKLEQLANPMALAFEEVRFDEIGSDDDYVLQRFERGGTESFDTITSEPGFVFRINAQIMPHDMPKHELIYVVTKPEREVASEQFWAINFGLEECEGKTWIIACHLDTGYQQAVSEDEITKRLAIGGAEKIHYSEVEGILKDGASDDPNI